MTLTVLCSCCVGNGTRELLDELDRVRLDGVDTVEEAGVVRVLLVAGAAKALVAASSVSSGVPCGSSSTSAIDIGSFTCTMHTGMQVLALQLTVFFLLERQGHLPVSPRKRPFKSVESCPLCGSKRDASTRSSSAIYTGERWPYSCFLGREDYGGRGNGRQWSLSHILVRARVGLTQYEHSISIAESRASLIRFAASFQISRFSDKPDTESGSTSPNTSKLLFVVSFWRKKADDSYEVP